MKKAYIWAISTIFGGIIAVLIQDINTWAISKKPNFVLPTIKIDGVWGAVLAILSAFFLIFICCIAYMLPFLTIPNLISPKMKVTSLFRIASKITLPIFWLVSKISERNAEVKEKNDAETS